VKFVADSNRNQVPVEGRNTTTSVAAEPAVFKDHVGAAAVRLANVLETILQ
jgi:hypothetical protein